MAKTKFRPLHDRVVVRRLDAEEKTAGGIIIPDTAKEKPSQGEITAVGDIFRVSEVYCACAGQCPHVSGYLHVLELRNAVLECDTAFY